MRQQLGRLVIYLLSGWVVASLALSGDIFQGTNVINLQPLSESVLANSDLVLLTLGMVFFFALLYWYVRRRKDLVEAFGNALSGRKTNLGKPKWGLLGYAIGITLLVGILLTLRYFGILPTTLPLRISGNQTVSLPPIIQPNSISGSAKSGLLGVYQSLATWTLIILVFATAGIIVVILAQSLVRLMSPESTTAQPQSALAEETIDVLDEATKDLREGDDYRKTILACYRQLCGIFDSRIEVGHYLLTARELQEVMVRQFTFAAKPISQLTALFEEARYSAHLISPPMRDNAIQALGNIEESLRNPPEIRDQTIF